MSVLDSGAFVPVVNSNRSYSESQKTEDDLEQILMHTGYSYDLKQNTFYQNRDTWQKKYGYCQLYDEALAPLGMILDCEPIRFEYDNKKWLIELWKGQYGMTTGCEIGIYTTTDKDLNIPNMFTGTFYQCATEEDYLTISASLSKSDRILFTRNDTHWWLTGFVLGAFSEPSELVMDVTITLKDEFMRKAFANRLKEMGYSDQEVGVTDNTVKFTFSKPHSVQPLSRTILITTIAQAKNKFLCEVYKSVVKDSDNIVETLKDIEENFPELYSLMINIGKPEKLFQGYEVLKK